MENHSYRFKKDCKRVCTGQVCFLVGATLAMGTLCHKTGIRSHRTSESSLVPVFTTLAPILVVIIFVPLGRITNKCLFKLSNRIGRHNRINDRLCDRFSRRPSWNDCLLDWIYGESSLHDTTMHAVCSNFRRFWLDECKRCLCIRRRPILTQCRLVRLL